MPSKDNSIFSTKVKRDNYNAILDFIRNNQGHNEEFYLRWIIVLFGYSEDKAEEMFGMLKNSGWVTIDEKGKIAIEG